MGNPGKTGRTQAYRDLPAGTSGGVDFPRGRNLEHAIARSHFNFLVLPGFRFSPISYTHCRSRFPIGAASLFRFAIMVLTQSPHLTNIPQAVRIAGSVDSSIDPKLKEQALEYLIKVKGRCEETWQVSFPFQPSLTNTSHQRPGGGKHELT